LPNVFALLKESAVGSNANPGRAAADSRFRPAAAKAGWVADRYTAGIARPMSDIQANETLSRGADFPA
jgi:hypothetical protein